MGLFSKYAFIMHLYANLNHYCPSLLIDRHTHLIRTARKYKFVSNNFFLSLQLSTLPTKRVPTQVLQSLIFGFPFVRLYKVLF